MTGKKCAVGRRNTLINVTGLLDGVWNLLRIIVAETFYFGGGQPASSINISNVAKRKIDLWSARVSFWKVIGFANRMDLFEEKEFRDESGRL